VARDEYQRRSPETCPYFAFFGTSRPSFTSWVTASPSFSVALSREPFAAPKLDGMVVDQPFCLFDCVGVIGTKQRFESGKVAITANDVCAVLCHPVVPTAG
jgi:hypothetical protein